MPSWIEQIFTSRDFAVSLAVAMFFFLFGQSWGFLWRFFQSVRQSYREFSISGFWVGTCALPSYQNKQFIELWRFTQRRERVHLTFFAYPPPGVGNVDKCAGMGVLSGGILSAVYYSVLPNSYESGVVALRLRGLHLAGSYSQFDVGSPDEKFFASDTGYSLHRVRLSSWKALRFALGIDPFSGRYEEVTALCAGTPLEASVCLESITSVVTPIPGDDSEALLRWVEKVESAKGPRARRTTVESALRDPRLTRRDEFIRTAAKIELNATLDKVETLKNVAARKRHLIDAIEALRTDSAPDHLQAAEIRVLEDQLQALASSNVE
jgi:hypothetical protein